MIMNDHHDDYLTIVISALYQKQDKLCSVEHGVCPILLQSTVFRAGKNLGFLEKVFRFLLGL